MNRIEQILRQLKSEQRTALMPFLTAGYPTIDALPDLLHACVRGGAQCVEIGFPFSDPIADGPVIASSMEVALRQGISPEQIFEAVDRVRSELEIGLIAMVSQSIITRFGAERFVQQCSDAGFDGLIVPDLDLDDAPMLRGLVDARAMTLSLLVAPTTSDTRLEQVLNHCSGFVYLLARLGITGEQQASPQIEPLLSRVRQRSDLPVAVGFGISTPEHVEAVSPAVDAVIVGSALVRRLQDGEDPAATTEQFIRLLVEAAGHC